MICSSLIPGLHFCKSRLEGSVWFGGVTGRLHVSGGLNASLTLSFG